jgi:hypothetical protein
MHGKQSKTLKKTCLGQIIQVSVKYEWSCHHTSVSATSILLPSPVLGRLSMLSDSSFF